MDWTLEVVVLPVSDIGRSIASYRDQVGFHLDHVTQNEHVNVTQLTPPGSGCSIVFGDLPAQRAMEPGSMKNLQLVAPDAASARQELLERGVEVSELTVITGADGRTFFGLQDPDGTRGLCRRSRRGLTSRSSRRITWVSANGPAAEQLNIRTRERWLHQQ